MAKVVQPTEYPGKYGECFHAVKLQMMKSSKLTKKYTEKQIEVKIKQALIEKAKDKIEFSLRGQLNRGVPKKKGMSEEEFEKLWREKMKERLKMDGFPFELKPEEKKILKEMQAKEKEEAIAEAAKIASEALKGIFSSIK